MKAPQYIAALAASLAIASSASAAPIVFNVSLNGANEILGGAATGDLDGSAIGTITLDAGSGGNTATASWNFTLANLATPPVTNYHIHTGTAIQQGGVFIGFGVDTGAGDILTSTEFSGSRTGLSSANMTTVLANPTNFYLNLHNNEFPGGAVRGQIPEPSSMILALGGLSALGLRRRRVG